MPLPREDEIRSWVRRRHPDESTFTENARVKSIVSLELHQARANGEITTDEWERLASEYDVRGVQPIGRILYLSTISLQGWFSSQLSTVGSDVDEMIDTFGDYMKNATITSEEGDPLTYSDDGEYSNRQDESLDLWDNISVVAETTTGDDDIQVVDDIETEDETTIDEKLFYDTEDIPDMNPVDDFEDVLHPFEYDVREDDIEDLISYPEQEIDDAVAFFDTALPFDSFQETFSDDQHSAMVLQSLESIGGGGNNQFGSIIDLQTQTDDVFADVLNEATEDHLGVAAFQFFDSDNIIFDKFATGGVRR